MKVVSIQCQDSAHKDIIHHLDDGNGRCWRRKTTSQEQEQEEEDHEEPIAKSTFASHFQDGQMDARSELRTPKNALR